MKNFRRHLLPIVLTPILLMCGWLVVGIPILFVFILDDAFRASDLLTFMIYAIGIGLGISVFFAVPVTWVVEKVFGNAKVIIVLIAGTMLLGSIFIFFGYLFDGQSMFASYPWSGSLLVFLFTVASYLLIFILSNLRKSQPSD